MNDETGQAWQQRIDDIQQHLDSIEQKEKLLTSGMRNLADQADALMAEMSRFKETLGSIKPAVQKADPEKSSPNIQSPTLESWGHAIKPKPDVNQEVEPEPPVQPQELTYSSSWLDREIQNRESQKNPEQKNVEAAVRPESWQIGSSEKAHPPQFSTPNYESFELNLGIKWLSRIGIVALLIGMAMALSYSFPAFPKELKIITGFLLATILWFGGTRLYNNAPILSRVLQGGGLAVGYLSLFAIFFIPAVQLLDAPILGFPLLLAYVAGVLVLSHRINSQSMSLLSLAFGYYTAGYAINDGAAFISTGMLILGAAGLAKMHPNWSVIPKANLLGAFWTYSFWDRRSTETFSQLYLAYVFLVFHVISALRAGRGDTILNVLNAFGCYFLYSFTQPMPAKSGVLEFLMATVQLGTLSLLYLHRPQQREESLPLGMLILGLIFGLFGVSRYFDAQQQTMILSALALCFGMLARKNVYRSVLQMGAYITLFWSGWNLMLSWADLTHFSLMWNAAWLTVSAFLLEGFAFNKHSAVLRGAVLSYAMVLYLCAICTAVPSEWRTISMVLSGFILLTTGFLGRRQVYRWLGLGWIFGLGGLSLIRDLVMLSTLYKILLFVLLGVGLLGGSYGYVLLEKTLRQQDNPAVGDEELLFKQPREEAE